MEKETLIALYDFCEEQEIDHTFILALNEQDLVEIFIIEGKPFLSQEALPYLKNIIRLYHEFDVQFGGKNVLINLLNKISELQNDLQNAKKKIIEMEEELVG